MVVQNRCKKWVIWLVCLGWAVGSWGQEYYVRLKDASSLDVSRYQESLEKKAKELAAQFVLEGDSTFAKQFKVLDWQ